MSRVTNLGNRGGSVYQRVDTLVNTTEQLLHLYIRVLVALCVSVSVCVF